MTAFSGLVINSQTLAEGLQKAASAPFALLDVRSADEFALAHIRGAHRLDPALLNHNAPPMNGLLPPANDVADWASQLGLDSGTTVVLYDAGKSTAAARAVWVLNVYGFTNVHWLNGGLAAWTSNGHPVTGDPTPAPAAASKLALSANSELVLTNEELKARYEGASNTTTQQVIDARSKAEFDGSDVRSARGGHMPGAVHYEWLDMFQADGTLQPDKELLAAVAKHQLNKDTPAVVYCQSHQRSSVTYVVLKHLGFTQVAALDGAWSNWGNDPTAPIEN